jgi:hypothetical protein
MSHLPQLTNAGLDRVADELVGAFAAEGYLVESAVQVHEAFEYGARGRPGLTGDLATWAVISALRGIDTLTFRRVGGTGIELQAYEGGIDRRFRVRKGKRNAKGELIVQVNGESSYAVDDDTVSLFPPERWVMVYELDDNMQIVEVVAAERTGYIDGKPGRLELGREFMLGGREGPTGPTGPHFNPKPDDDIFGDEGDAESEKETGS